MNDDALRGVVNDPDADENRLWALACLRAWGNPNDPQEHAVDPNTGKRMRLADFTRELGVSKQTVSRWAKLLAESNRLHVTVSGVYPVDDPSKPSEIAHFVRESGQMAAKYKTYLDRQWNSSPEGRREQQLRDELKTLLPKKLAGFKAFLRSSQESGTNDEIPPSLPDDSVPDSDAPSAALPNAYIRKREDLDIAPPASSSESSLVAAALNEYAKTDDDATNKLISACKAENPECTGEQIAAAVHEKAERLRTGNVSNPIGFFIAAVPKIITQVAHPANHRATVPDHLLPTGVRRLRGTVADAEMLCRANPLDEGLQRELQELRSRLSQTEEEYGLR